MGAPAIPTFIPAGRLAALTMRSLPERDGLEAESFPYLTDADEWAVYNDEDRATISQAFPRAKFFTA